MSPVPLRSALRLFRAHPGFCAVVALTFALAIGATGAAYTILHGTVLPELPVADPERIVSLRLADPADGSPAEVPLGLLRRWRDAAASVDALAGYTEHWAFVGLGEAGTTGYVAAEVTPDLFRLLGVSPVAGRGFEPADAAPGAPAVALLGHDAWARDLGRDPRAVGSTIRVDREPVIIVGVLPEGFGFPSGQEIWTVLRARDHGEGELRRVVAVGRLAHGSSRQAAQAELEAIAARSGWRADAADARPTTVRVEPFVAARTDPRLRSAAAPMLLAMAAVLLLGCANVANLLLARAEGDRHGTAIRAALGAGRVRLAAATVAQTLLLAAVGGLGGLLLTALLAHGFDRLMRPGRFLTASWIDVGVDPEVFGFLLLATAGSALLAAALPVLRLAAIPPGEALGGHGAGVASRGGSGRVGSALVLVEVVLATALLLVAGALVRNVLELRSVDLGVEAPGVITAKVSTHPADALDEEAERRFFRRLSRRLEALPEVETVGFGAFPPTEGSFRREVEAPGGARVEVRWQVVTPGFFDALGVPLLRGRTFGADGGPQDEVVVNRSFAERHLADAADPVGATLRLAPSPWEARPEPEAEPQRREVTLVGVVDDYEMARTGEDRSAPAVFTSVDLDPHSSLILFARPPEGMVVPPARVCREAAAIHPGVACFHVRPLAEILQHRLWVYDAAAALFASLGAMALLLGATGIFGVLSFQVRRREREIGVRLALGATRRAVRRLVLRRFVVPAAAGLAAGLGVGVAGVRLLGGLLPGIEGADPVVLVGTVVALALAVLLAVHRPTRRAARVDPANLLREE